MRALTFVGKLLVSLGCGVLLFVGWTLWGTGIYTNQQQQALEQAWGATPSVAVVPASSPSEDEDPVVKVADGFRPGPGRPVFRIRIPKIKVDEMVVEGVGTEELRKGPGHYPACRDGFAPPLCLDGVESFWPGEAGRVIVSGHRTTYGAPFYDLDKLGAGDRIVTETKWGDFTYVVTEQVVLDADEPVTVTPGDPELVLTTCNPKYSAAERLLIFARLKDVR
ncbi:MAG TPA: sortase [Actinomycetota bacterium]|nr:sortase [Actinomycetota bacterium]